MNLRGTIAVLAVLPSLSFAGGDNAYVTVTELVEAPKGQFRVVVALAQPEPFQLAPGCQTFTVEGEWYSRPSNKPPDSTHQGHERALATLREARTSGKPLLFGAMLDGLPKREAPCTFGSRGLTVTIDGSDRLFVLSYAN